MRLAYHVLLIAKVRDCTFAGIDISCRAKQGTLVIVFSSLSFALEPEGSFREGTLVVYIGGEIFGNGGSPGSSEVVVFSTTSNALYDPDAFYI